jgi:hypothetical protein
MGLVMNQRACKVAGKGFVGTCLLQGTSNNPWISILNDTIRHLYVEDLRNSLLLRAIFALI